MSKYLMINLVIVSFPLIFSIILYRFTLQKLFSFFLSFIVVGIPFIIWDIVATGRGDWSFNPSYINGVKFFGLPFEEILFFITVPYASLFLFESIRYIIFDTEVSSRYKILFLILFLVFFFSGLYFIFTPYTSTVLLVTSFSCLMLYLCFNFLLKGIHFYLYLLLMMLLFIIFNSLLTGMPIVLYSKNSILNIRLGTIPVEDFFYNFSMLVLYLGVYELINRKDLKK